MSIKVSYVEFDYNKTITSCNKQFQNQFSICNNGVGENVFDLFDLNEHDLLEQILQELAIGANTNFVLVANSHIANHETLICAAIYYGNIKRNSSTYEIKFTNYLTWSHYIHQSRLSAYDNVANINTSCPKSVFSMSSTAHAINALYPFFIAKRGHETCLDSVPMNEVGAIFFSKNNPTTKINDLKANVVKSVSGQIKKELGRYDVSNHSTDILCVLKNSAIYKVEYEDEVYLPRFSLHKNILLKSKKDSLLNSLLDYFVRSNSHEIFV